MMREHPEAYSASANVQLSVRPLRDQIAAPARTILLVLLAAAAVVFVIACSNVANLILARSVRRERRARGARRARRGRRRAPADAARREPGALRRRAPCWACCWRARSSTVVGRYAARFSVRALEVTVDPSVLWVGAGLAMAAAVLLAYVPRLPSAHGPAGLGLASGGLRITPGTNRRLRVFATRQIALSFVLLAGAGMILAALVALQTANTGYDMRQVLAIDVPLPHRGLGPKAIDFFQEATRRISELPGVEQRRGRELRALARCRQLRPSVPVHRRGLHACGRRREPARAVADRHPRLLRGARRPAPRRPRLHRRRSRAAASSSSIVSQSVAQRLFPNGDAVNRHLWWTDPYFGKPRPRRIVGVVADVDDENVVPGPALTVYHPLRQMAFGGRLFVHAAGDPYALVPAVTRVIREISADQPVERAATLEDVRAEVLSPERLNAFVFSGFAGIALLIAVVGVAGVLAFSVSARTREFGVRLAVGSTPRHLLARVLSEGALIAAIGIVAGAAGGYALGRRGGEPCRAACSCRAPCPCWARRPCSWAPRSWRR